MIDIATALDLADLLRMSKEFKEASPYKDDVLSEERLTQFITTLLNLDNRVGILMVYRVEGKPVGMVAGVIHQMMFSDDKSASEIVWYVEPEHRGTTVGKQLHLIFEHWAKHVAKCKYLTMSLLENSDTKKLRTRYKKEGYVPKEQVFIKTL